MPHLLIERTRWFPSLLSAAAPKAPQWVQHISEKGGIPQRYHTQRPIAGAITIELLDLSASVMFLIGSICFLPEYASNIETFLLGCDLFVLGSLIYSLLTTYTLVEAVKTKGTISFEAYENALYLAGSWCYLLGTLLYWPEPGHVAPFIAYINDKDNMPHSKKEIMFELLRSTRHGRTVAEAAKAEEQHRRHMLGKRLQKSSGVLGIDINFYFHEWTGSLLFIIGSLFFTFAAFANALKQRKFLEWNAVIISATSLYMAGSLQFVMGSVCFLPELGADRAMARFGAWCFISGSILYLLGNIISLSRTVLKLVTVENEPLIPAALDDGSSPPRMPVACATSGSDAANPTASLPGGGGLCSAG